MARCGLGGKRIHSLKGDHAFRRVRRGRAGQGKLLSLRWIRNGEGCIRVGIVVNKKVGKAVVRNRVRRRLHEALRKNLSITEGEAGVDLVMIARPEAAGANYGELERSLRRALEKAGLK